MSFLLLLAFIQPVDSANAEMELVYFKRMGARTFLTKVYIKEDLVHSEDYLDVKSQMRNLQGGDLDAMMSSDYDKSTTFKKFQIFDSYINQLRITERRRGDGYVTVADSLILPIWEISAETKHTPNGSLQKATCRYYGRDYIVWFNPEIPVTVGPFRFHGLPGLIHEITSIDGEIMLKLKTVNRNKPKFRILNVEKLDTIKLMEFINIHMNINSVIASRVERVLSEDPDAREGSIRISIPEQYNIDFETSISAH